MEVRLENAARSDMQGMIGAFRVSQMIAVAARLRIADHLAEGPRALDDLARVTGTHEDSLYRMLRALACHGVFSEAPERTFRLTPRAGWLRSDVPHSLRVTAEVVGDEWLWRPWGELLHSVTTGETAFDHLYGQSTWTWFDEHPAAAARFNEFMDAITIAETEAVVSACDFAGARTIVDVAGGRGVLLAEILRRYPGARGVLFNLPSVIESARDALGNDSLDRMDFVSGDFFREVPAGGDIYILKNIIHDWDDDRARQILASCRRAMRIEASTLLVVEHVVRPAPQSCLALMADVQMMVRAGGRNRTEKELRELLASSGFRLERVISTTGPDVAEASLIE
jgi:hypothetical protein